ncbi:MAG TPA: chromosome segregation protein SMC [Streptosporangiaceae bacterium]|nr:chromosome segregation protein SMC [Streptosporangiaceae bacterium]
MYLKTLTLRGFKSFATTTTFRFEPGITCIVGPNGSGKSNIVDAFAWVMGEQGVKPLRGGKMDDVVFAGTSARPPLGRAEVALTIDNSDGTLPIDYSEVTISRLLFRSGQSEYAINGDQCRLLDVAELLSDTGLGREMHVIVGQGQLDEVLNAGPEARRALIEEAAGVLKHRRRKEKAVRKLDAMQANLTRLVDLTGELGRRLKPLGRQAEIAKKAAVIQAELRDARLRLLADDYQTLAAELERDQADEAAAAQLRAVLETALTEARADEAGLEAAEQQHAPRLAAAQDAFFALSGLAERMRGVLGLATERQRYLSVPEPARAGRDPDELDREAAQLRAAERELTDRLGRAREQLIAAVAERQRAEAALAENERRLAADARAAAQRADRLARLRGQVEAAMSRAAAAQEEGDRLAAAAEQARARAEQAQVEYAALQDRVANEGSRADLAAAHERAAEARAAASARVAELRRAEHEVSAERAGLRARAAALAEAVAGGADGAGVLLAASSGFDGVLGPLAALLTVADGAQDAIAAALGTAASSVAVAGLDAAVAIMTELRSQDVGQASLVIAADGARSAGVAEANGLARSVAANGVGKAALDLVSAPPEFAGAVADLLGDVVVVPDLATAVRMLRAEPRLRVVTADGDVLGTHFARGGSAGSPSLLSLRAAASQSADRLDAADAACQRAERQLAAALDNEEQASQAVAAAAAALQQADAAAAETSGELGSLAGRARAARDEVGRLTAAIAAAEQSHQRSLAHVGELRARLAELAADEPPAGAQAAAEAEDPGAAGRQRLAEDAVAARGAEMEARLEVRTVEERLRASSGRADALAAAAAAERQAAARAAARAERRAALALVAGAVVTGATVGLSAVERSAAAADAERQQAEGAHQRRDGELRHVRSRIRTASDELEQVMDSARGAEVARATRQLQLDQIAERALADFAVEAAVLTAEYGPDEAFDRAVTERRAQHAQRQLDQLGKVNPLALEEFTALEERHAFLVSQLEDLKKTRRDLLTVIREVDERVQQVFSAAYADTAREFASVIARLFPGGEGRLVLTDPDDLLATGIDVEARPPGKKVKRLSLLSGGERAMTAIAFLIAIFKARPSPFYVLDEVEAALDDTNLQRLLQILAELREASQLIVVTHQKRTMEVADTLYGISMRGDGVSTVISQRLRERETV